VYLSSPVIAAASAVAGFITSPDLIPAGKIEDHPEEMENLEGSFHKTETSRPDKKKTAKKPEEFTGRVWILRQDDIDTDMIYHNRHLTITDIGEMGRYALGNLEGFESFAGEAKNGDILFAGKNFGAGSSRQQAVDCFISLGISCIVAESFGSIYERNAINAAFPILSAEDIAGLELTDGDRVHVNIKTGIIQNEKNNKQISARPFSEVQMEIYQNGGLF
jgi:3-isopropylmalate dehydratase small subunit